MQLRLSCLRKRESLSTRLGLAEPELLCYLGMIEFSFPNCRALLPSFYTNCPDGSHFAQMGSHFLLRIPPPTLVLHSAVTPFSGICIMYVHKTPQTPPQNTHFPGLNLKKSKMKYRLGNLDPNWAVYLKSGQNVSRNGQK